MSPSSFMLVLAIMLVTIVAIYVTLFSFGTGFGDKADRWIRFGDKEKGGQDGSTSQNRIETRTA